MTGPYAIDGAERGPADELGDLMAVEVFARIADKWTQYVLWALRRGRLRHYELRAELPGVSTKMLVQTLRALQRDGLVSRESDGGSPPRVAYALTPAGRELFELTNRICSWPHANAPGIQAARDAYAAGHAGTLTSVPAGADGRYPKVPSSA